MLNPTPAVSQMPVAAPSVNAPTGHGLPFPARSSATTRTQREALLEVLRLAAQCDAWMSLEELAAKTKFPPASISAQLRHLRKPAYGAWKVEKRRRAWQEGSRHTGREFVWEYKIAV